MSAAAAGAVAVKTAERLNAILPKNGAGRNVLVLVAAATYAEWASFLSGRIGYNYFVCRGTVTDATSGSVAFSDSATDRFIAGGVTATGLNAGGYNPTGTPSATQVQCLKVGGGAPGFPAEVPISLPGGCRWRFDVNTTTAALRNFCTTVVAVSGGDTLQPAKQLPAVPVASDVFYLEMPGAIFQKVIANGVSADIAGALQVVGLQASGASSGGRGFYLRDDAQAAFCWNGSGLMECNSGIGASLNSAYPYNGAQIDTGGACRASGGIVVAGQTSFTVPTGLSPYCNTITAQRTGDLELPSAFVAVSGVSIDLTSNVATNEADADNIGTDTLTETGVRASRILGGSANACGLYLGASVCLGSIEFSGMGANPAIKMVGQGLTTLIRGPLANGAAGGNTDVGLDLTSAYGCTIVLLSTPTVTGAAGDVRLGGGQIANWAALAATGITDTHGNRFVSASGPLVPIKTFSGIILTSNVAPTFGYLADIGTEDITPTANQTDPIGYPTSARLITRLRGCQRIGTGAQPPTFTLYRNGVATAQTATLPANTGGIVQAVDLAHPILFADGDIFDVRCDVAITGEGNQPVTATLEGPC